MTGASTSEARQERWFDAFQVSWQPVPLPLYDEWLKPAERAYGEMVELIDRYEDAFQAILDIDDDPGIKQAAEAYGAACIIATRALR